MFTEKIDLYEYFSLTQYKTENSVGILTTYIPEKYICYSNRIRPAMLVIAGGGYGSVSQREKECIALSYVANGFASFTLDYSCAPVRYPSQLLEACMALIYIRENAEKFAIDNNHVAGVGFSAGGHLVGMLATIPDEIEVKEILGERIKNAYLDAVILSYAVITSGEKAHNGSFDNLCGDNLAIRQRLSLENRVTEKSAPAFIWATANDGCVPSENSLYMALAYKKAGVPFELHIFEDGAHGLSLATKETYMVKETVQCWLNLSLNWLKTRGFEIID